MGPNAAEKLDPVELAFENAPEGDPLTPDEVEALAEAEAEMEAGGTLIPHDEVMRRVRAHFGVE